MAIYGRGQMLGSGINPESFKQDYSGFANAAAMQAQGIASLGQSIGGAIQDYGKFKKQQQQDERDVQKSKSVAKAIGDLIPDLKPTLQNSLMLLDNKELPLSQRKAEADAISDILTLGIGAITNKQKMAIDLAQIEATRNRGSGVTSSLQRGKKRLVIDGQTYEIDINYDPKTGVSVDDYGNVISDPFGAAGQIDSALNLPAVGGDVSGAITNTTGVDIPSLLPSPPPEDVTGIQEALAMPDGNAGLANVNPMPPGTPTMTEVPRVDGVPPILSRPEPQAAVTPPVAGRQPSRIPPGAVLVGKQDDIDEIKIIDTDMVKRMGLDPNKVYIAKYRGDKMVSPPELPGQDSKGRMFRLNPETGAVEYIEGVSSMDLNKPPTTNLKEGQALVPDPTSPTGTKVVEIPSDLKEKALNNFSNYIAQVGDSYAKLNQMGKAVSGGEANPLNYVFATPIGQTMGRMFGEEGQILRDQINTMAPNIVNVIRQSTEMGAKGMDSDSERLFFIKSMGDPTLPIEANIKALDALDKAYGKGNAVETMLKNYPELAEKVNKYKLTPPKTESGATGGLITPEQQSLIDKYKPKSR